MEAVSSVRQLQEHLASGGSCKIRLRGSVRLRRAIVDAGVIEKLDVGKSVDLVVPRLVPREVDRAWGQIVLAKAESIDVQRAEFRRLGVLWNRKLDAEEEAAGAPSRRAIYRFFRDIGEAGVNVALVALADHRATWGVALDPEHWARLVEVVSLLLTHWYERREQTITPPKLISGRDLMEQFGLEEGPRIGELLEAVREAQAMGQVRTREEALAWVKKLVAAAS